MSAIKSSIFNLLKGDFLVNKDSFKNWRFIFFVVILMLLMIASAHSTDKKVMEIAKLTNEIKELRAEFLDKRAISMEMRLESTVRKKVVNLGIVPSEQPPQVIRVITKK
ncbi:S-adenosyl-methyltransferase [Lutibacter sp. A80]|uniref:FtsL-like putative cell division protein n=1 Tax=Lutibacter sp. A80 TaxID=2918453 RepID=UPI001F053077|nr:FtsL-like putative cell division protein [Lutibacter sp. A80]UMB62118.1 S-adenosyl-methyltransferase [Lutibacter sp. A80]